MKETPSWHWSALGKHPVAKDFFRFGLWPPMAAAFAEWLDRGYQKLVREGDPRKGPPGEMHSWRFWARGLNEKGLVCGIGRDSSDSLGRPYPLLILGAGSLDGWREHWDLLCLVLDGIWTQMEAIAARRFSEFRQLEEGLRLIKAPHPRWEDWEKRGNGISRSRASGKGISGPCRLTAAIQAPELIAERCEFIASLGERPSCDALGQACQWHVLLRRHMPGIPHAVFMGGVPQAVFLAVFRRPLAPEDFVNLWTTPGDGATAYGPLVAG